MKKYYLLILIVFIAIMYNTVNRNRIIAGYCSKEEKNLFELYSKQQLVDKAILYAIERDNRWKVKNYASINEFKQINPNCCNIELNMTKDISFREKVYGYVNIKYWRHYLSEKHPTKIDDYIRFTPCGDMADGTRGFTIGVL